jgi:hypothetical protein
MVASRPQPARGGGITTLHISLIVFVALWLTFTVIAVLLYTGREDLVKAAADAEKQSDRLMRKGEATKFAPFLDLAGEKQSLASVLNGEREALAKLIGVDVVTSALDANNIVNTAIGKLSVGVPPGATPPEVQGASLLTVVDRLQTAWKAEADARVDAQNRLKESTQKLEKLAEDQAKEQKKFQQALADAAAQTKNLEAANAKFQREKDQQVKDLDQRIRKLRDEADEQLIKSQADKRKVQQQCDQYRAELRRTQEQLNQFRPKVATLSPATAADAEVIRAQPEESVVYINLGQEDHLMLGLRFKVFSASGGDDPNSPGKATIEVVNIHPKVAECRVIASNPADPIVPGDLCANVVYSRDRKYRFVVEGGFDLAGTRRFDPQDADKIKAWIEAWGGEVVTLPSLPAKGEICPVCGQPVRPQSLGFETVDFLVLGEPPMMPQKLGPDAKPEDRARVEAQRAAYDRYMRVEQQAKETGVGILRQPQFLNLIGFGARPKPVALPERSRRAVMVP